MNSKEFESLYWLTKQLVMTIADYIENNIEKTEYSRLKHQLEQAIIDFEQEEKKNDDANV